MRYSVVIAVYILFLVFAFINSDKEKKKSFSIGGAVIVWGTFLVMTLLIMLSMVNHTIMVILFGAENLNKTYHIREALYQIPYIGGLQGRYFIPLMFPAYLSLCGAGDILSPSNGGFIARKTALCYYLLELFILALTVWRCVIAAFCG